MGKSARDFHADILGTKLLSKTGARRRQWVKDKIIFNGYFGHKSTIYVKIDSFYTHNLYIVYS